MELKGLKELQIEIIGYFDLSECLCLDFGQSCESKIEMQNHKDSGFLTNQ